MRFWFITFPWPRTLVGDWEDVLCNGTGWNKGDLMVLGSNQEVQRATRWNRCWGGCWHVLEQSFLFLYSCHHLLLGQGTKIYRGQECHVIYPLCINPALWHNSLLTLIPYLSESKTCLNFDGKPHAVLTGNSSNLGGSYITEPHQRHDRVVWSIKVNRRKIMGKLWIPINAEFPFF